MTQRIVSTTMVKRIFLRNRIMKAIYYEQHGNADVLQYGELPTPDPDSDQVLVKIAVAAVNPIDRRLRSGELQEYISRTFPIVPGWDFSGTIVKIGSNVTNWKVGDEVVGLAFTWSIQHGTYAEYCPVDASAIALKPPGLSFVDAASLPLVSLTAWQALDEFAGLKRGQTVLIQAGAGGVGSVAIPIAKHLGAKVYTTTRSENFNYVMDRGADHPIDYTTHDYVEVIKEMEPDGLDVVLESLYGDKIVEDAIHLTKNGGAVPYLNNEPPELADIASRSIKTEFIHHRPDGEMLAMLMSLFASGDLLTPRVTTMNLSDATKAHEQSERMTTNGKLVLQVEGI
jgi:NADPH:quinone reductase-like Zn-dependent oxidoreductase